VQQVGGVLVEQAADAGAVLRLVGGVVEVHVQPLVGERDGAIMTTVTPPAQRSPP
jgi:hypothetical protein